MRECNALTGGMREYLRFFWLTEWFPACSSATGSYPPGSWGFFLISDAVAGRAVLQAPEETGERRRMAALGQKRRGGNTSDAPKRARKGRFSTCSALRGLPEHPKFPEVPVKASSASRRSQRWCAGWIWRLRFVAAAAGVKGAVREPPLEKQAGPRCK